MTPKQYGPPLRDGAGRRYAGWLAVTFVAIVAISAAPLWMFYRNGGDMSAQQLFGDLRGSVLSRGGDADPPGGADAGAVGAATDAGAAAGGSALAAPPLRAEQPAALRTGHAGEPARPPQPIVAASPDTTNPDSATVVAAAEQAALEAAAAEAASWQQELDIARELATAQQWDAALRAYETLVRRRPADVPLAAERASVLAWSGKPSEAAVALLPLTLRAGSPAELRLERARYLWWAGHSVEAEALLSEIVAADDAATAAAARELRSTVRAALESSPAVARRWLAEEQSAAAHLWLARALARDGAAGLALPHLRHAMAGGASPRDVTLLELASLAMTADSMVAAAAALEAYLAEFDARDRAARLRLARAYAWHGETARAIALLTALIDELAEAELYHERARLYVAANELDRAETDLMRYLALRPNEADAVALLEDIESWRGPVVVAAADASPQDARRPAVWRVESEGFGDSERFRAYAIEAYRQWLLGTTPAGEAAFGVAVRHDQTQGVEGVARSGRVEGFGIAGDGALRVSDAITASAAVGLRYYTTVGALPTWMLGTELRNASGAWLLVCYEHEPAVRRASTAAALEAKVLSDRLRAAAEASFAGWVVAGQLEGERLGSELGTSRRLGGSAWLGRTLAPGLSASAGVGALTTDGDVPQLPGWGALYWMPRWYVAPAISLRYEAALSERWSAAARVAPSYAFVSERAGDERFPSSRLGSGLGLDIGYAHPAWHVGVSADWSGAVEQGYRAATLRVRITPR